MPKMHPNKMYFITVILFYHFRHLSETEILKQTSSLCLDKHVVSFVSYSSTVDKWGNESLADMESWLYYHRASDDSCNIELMGRSLDIGYTLWV